jgi:hypothetical protein
VSVRAIREDWGMNTISHLRGIPALRHLRGRHPAVVVCLDDPAPFERRAEELAALEAELVVEREPGDLSARLGRPSVTVADRYLEVELHGAAIAPEDAVKTVRWLESRCEECPQSHVDMHQTAGEWA